MTMGDDVSVEQGIGTGAEGRLVRLFLHVKLVNWRISGW
jgi:hypothetical protein